MIISKENEKIKYLKKLKMKKYRDKENKFLIFGNHLIKEALEYGNIIELFTSNIEKSGTLVSKEIMQELNFTETIYDICALCNKKKEITNNSKRVLILEDVQDPENVGALIRSAAAFEFDQVVLSNKCADIYNDKTIRASKGSIFHVDVIRTDIYKYIDLKKKEGYLVYVADSNGDEANKLRENSILIMGNEGQGVTDKVKKLSDYNLTIKTKKVESLNVSVAGAILMYEWSKI